MELNQRLLLLFIVLVVPTVRSADGGKVLTAGFTSLKLDLTKEDYRKLGEKLENATGVLSQLLAAAAAGNTLHQLTDVGLREERTTHTVREKLLLRLSLRERWLNVKAAKLLERKTDQALRGFQERRRTNSEWYRWIYKWIQLDTTTEAAKLDCAVRCNQEGGACNLFHVNADFVCYLGVYGRRDHAISGNETAIDLIVERTIRLYGGNGSHEGDVWALNQHKDKFGVVGDTNWGWRQANVACRQLGFTGGAKNYTKGSHFGSGKNDVMDNVICNGSEPSLQECVYRYSDNHHAAGGAICHEN